MLHICIIGIVLSMQINTLYVFNDSANNKDNPTSVNQNEIVQIPDTLFARFDIDTIILEKSVPISQIIYAEHKESIFYKIFLPIIMLVLGVLIDRFVQIFVGKP